jgi:HEAT repeat protein
MSNKRVKRPARPATPELADLVIPRRPSGIPYEHGGDYDAEALLTINRYTTETKTLIALLDSKLGILQSAAARTLGAKGRRSAIPSLQRIAQDKNVEETARVQAALALSRMKISGGKELLVEMLNLSPEASPAPLQAAGALASLKDPRGFPLVRSALDSPNPVTAMVACKQLLDFAALDGQPLPAGGRVETYNAFKRALERPEQNIRGEALAQLEALRTEQARAMLGAYSAGKR